MRRQADHGENLVQGYGVISHRERPTGVRDDRALPHHDAFIVDGVMHAGRSSGSYAADVDWLDMPGGPGDKARLRRGEQQARRLWLNHEKHVLRTRSQHRAGVVAGGSQTGRQIRPVMLHGHFHRPAARLVGNEVEGRVVEPADLVGMPGASVRHPAGGGDGHIHAAVERRADVAGKADRIADFQHIAGAHALWAERACQYPVRSASGSARRSSPRRQTGTAA